MKKLYRIGLLVLVLALMVGCATAAEATTPASTTSHEITIGFTASQTGKYNLESGRQVNGLNLWAQQVNDAGGIQVGSDSYTVNIVSYDDESTSDRVQELYTRLINEDNVDFLISPYSSGLTETAAVVADQYGKVMITTGAATPTTYQQGYTRIYQTYTPSNAYLSGAVDLLNTLNPGAKIAYVYENSSFATPSVEAAKAHAEMNGFETVLYQAYEPDSTDFTSFINQIEAAAPDAILGGGHFQDGSTFARQLYEAGVHVDFIALLVAPADDTFIDLGDAANGIIGPSQWEPLASFTAAAAQSEGMDFAGPDSGDFTSAYQAAYNEDPTYHAAGGYVSGLLLQTAIEKAGSTDPADVAAALDGMDILTFFGHIKFDTSADNHGLQIGHSMVYIQWQDGQKQMIWPAAGASADPLYPIP